MGMRLRHDEWQRQLWKLVTHPVAEIVALVVVVLLALVTLLTVESRSLRGTAIPVVYSPK